MPSHYNQVAQLGLDPRTMAEAVVSAAATTTDVATSVARRLPNKPSAAPPKYVPNAHQLSARKKRKAAETLAKAARTAKAAGGAKLVAKTVGKKLLVPLDVALSLNAGRKLLSSGGRENARNMVEDMSKKSALDRITESQSDPLGTLYGTASGVNKLVTQTNATSGTRKRKSRLHQNTRHTHQSLSNINGTCLPDCGGRRPGPSQVVTQQTSYLQVAQSRFPGTPQVGDFMLVS